MLCFLLGTQFELVRFVSLGGSASRGTWLLPRHHLGSYQARRAVDRHSVRGVFGASPVGSARASSCATCPSTGAAGLTGVFGASPIGSARASSCATCPSTGAAGLT